MLSRAQSHSLIALGAGAALPLAFAPFGWFWLAPVCYALLFYVWRGVAPGRAFRLGWLFGAASFLVGTHWTYISVHGFGGAPAALAVLLTGGLVAIMALYSGAVGWIAARWFGTSSARAWLLVLPALWVLAEWWRGWFLSGFGWLSAGYTQTDSWLLSLAPVGGVLAVSWAVLVLAGAITALACGASRERIAGALAAVAVVALAFGLDRVRFTEPKPSYLSVALVQGAVPQDLKWLRSQRPVTLALYRDLTEQVLGNQLIVWPEAALPDLYENLPDYLAGIERDAAAAGSVVMLGTLRYRADVDQAENALVTLGRPDAAYVKRHLVPYGEFYPVPGFVRRWLQSIDLLVSDLAAGAPDQRPFALLGERIAATICYEDVFGAEQLHAFPEATLLVNVSNDAWFGESIAPHQHLQIARLRAAEVGRYLLRATNTGVTAVIDPRGRLAATLPQFESSVLEATVQGYTGTTPYMRFGDWGVVVLALAALAAQALTTKLTIRPGT